ncbi:CoA transferase, partial [Thermodesulfobacteriota bacterium]
GKWAVEHTHYEVMEILQKADIACGPVLNAKELLQDPHLNKRGFFETVTHPEAGTHPYIGMYARFSKTPGGIRRPAPCLGEHNQYVFNELLGLSEDETMRLEQKGVIGTEPELEQQGALF